MAVGQCLSSFSRLFPRLRSAATQLGHFELPAYRQQCLRFAGARTKTQEVVDEDAATTADNKLSKKVIAKVNDQIKRGTHGRLFAVVHVAGQQYKVTTEDLVVIRHNWGPTAGDKIRLEKVLLVGSSDFTLIGRPILPLDQVAVYATVIEKTLTHKFPRFLHRQRSSFRKLHFYQSELTFLRITDISLKKVDESKETQGLDDRIF